MIDWTRASELFDDFGDEGFAELVTVFLEEGREGLDRLEHAATDEEHRAAFHFLKGAALNLGFIEIAEICALGESAATQGKDASQHKEKVRARLPDTCAVFEDQWPTKLLSAG